MSSAEVAELITTKEEILNLEKRIEDIFLHISKGDGIKGPRPSDFCARRMPVILYYDTVNTDLLVEKVQILLPLIIEFYKLREKQAKIEKSIAVEQAINNQIRNTMRTR